MSYLWACLCVNETQDSQLTRGCSFRGRELSWVSESLFFIYISEAIRPCGEQYVCMYGHLLFSSPGWAPVHVNSCIMAGNWIGKAFPLSFAGAASIAFPELLASCSQIFAPGLPDIRPGPEMQKALKALPQGLVCCWPLLLHGPSLESARQALGTGFFRSAAGPVPFITGPWSCCSSWHHQATSKTSPGLLGISDAEYVIAQSGQLLWGMLWKARLSHGAAAAAASNHGELF